MNTYRVTLRAFGTTGVLVAASLAMLATVSALVAFDGWPHGYGSSSIDSVPVTGATSASALVVRHARPAGSALTAARGAAPAGFVKVAGPVPGGATGGFAAGFVKTIGPGGGGSLGQLPYYPGPYPQVPYCPPGECSGPQSQPGPPTIGNIIPEPVRGTACGSAGSVCGVAQGAVTVPDLPAPVGTPSVGLPRAELPQVQVPVQTPVQLPGG